MNTAIIISEKKDVSTDTIIDYLNYYKIPNIRIDKEEIFENISVNLSMDENETTTLENNFRTITIENKQLVFYRRGGISKSYPFFTNNFVKKNLENDVENFQIYFHEMLENKIGDRNKEFYSNKLYNLKLAKESGLSIPPTLLTTSKQKLISFIREHEKTIAKPLRNGWFFLEKDAEFNFANTGLIDLDKATNLEDSFALTLFQSYVNKDLELRVFFTGNKFYSMAIFSQQNEKTSIDFRNYDDNNPNRLTPFLLPSIVEEKLYILTQKIGLTTGSIDLILTTNNDFVFLEVNPVGQFEWVSLNCNYYLEKEIALQIQLQLENGKKN